MPPHQYEIATLAKKGCRFCGSKTVTWQQSDEGKYYLTETFEIDGEIRSSRSDFHSKYCTTKPRRGSEPRLDHDDEQRKLTQREQDREHERSELRSKAEERANAKSADRFLELAAMSGEEKTAEILRLERQMTECFRNPPTMDYMTEYNRELAAQQQRQVEWKFLNALLGNPQEENFALPRG